MTRILYDRAGLRLEMQGHAGAGEKGRCFAGAEALIASLPTLVHKGDAILVKASRGARFERISEALKELIL